MNLNDWPDWSGLYTGWRTWKNSYKGAHVPAFQRKIMIAFTMMSMSLVLTFWRVNYTEIFLKTHTGIAHWVYLFGNGLLMLGASAEGYYGGRLNHH